MLAFEHIAGIDAPIVRCDVCKKRIDLAVEANVLYSPSETDVVATVHVGYCTRQYDLLLLSKRAAWMPLRLYLFYLTKNLGMDLHQAEDEVAAWRCSDLV